MLCLDRFPSPEADLQQTATELINRMSGINRIVARVESRRPARSEMHVVESSLSAERLARLRRADAIVRRLSHERGFDRRCGNSR